MRKRDVWAADTPISQPIPPTKPVLVDFQGFGFTAGGMCHNITEGESEELFLPLFAPYGYRGGIEGVDGGE